MASAARDIKTLQSISHRVHAAEECHLEAIVREVLCPVVLKLGIVEAKQSSWQLLGMCKFPLNLLPFNPLSLVRSFKTREALQEDRNAAAMELLSSLNDKIASHPSWRLAGASEELLCVFRHKVCPEYSNIAMLELVIVLKRCSLALLRSLAGQLATGISRETGQHQRELLHLTFYALTSFSTAIQDFAGDTASLPSAFTTSKDGRAKDQQEVLRFGLNLMLYYFECESESEPSPRDNPSPPPGLSLADVQELSQAPEGMGLDNSRSLLKRKLGLLNLCAICENLPPADVALIALTACDYSNVEVSGTAEYLLETRCSQTGVVCGQELEDEAFVERVFDLLAGSPEYIPHHMSKRAAPTPLRIRLYRLLCLSVTACNLSLRTLEVITVCVEDIVDPRDSELQQLACQFVLWVLENANEDVVAAVAQPILDGAIYALNLLTVAAPTSSPPIRKMLYQAVGQIAERAPQAFKGDVTTAAGFFGKLETEPLGLSEAVNEAVSRLACAYSALPCPEINEELQCMLKWQAEHTNERVRTCALVWALGIFPWDGDLHTRMEFLCAEVSTHINSTKLFEPQSHKHKTASANGASSSHAAELQQGWPEAWAVLQEKKNAGLLFDKESCTGHTSLPWAEVQRQQVAAAAIRQRQQEAAGQQAAAAEISRISGRSRQRSAEHSEVDWDWPVPYDEYGHAQQCHSDVLVPPPAALFGFTVPRVPEMQEEPWFQPWNVWADLSDQVVSETDQNVQEVQPIPGVQSLDEADAQQLQQQNVPEHRSLLHGTSSTSAQQEPLAEDSIHDISVKAMDANLMPVLNATSVAGPSEGCSEPSCWSQLKDENASRWLTCMENPTKNNHLEVFCGMEVSDVGSLSSWITGLASSHATLHTEVPTLAGTKGCGSRTLCALLTSLDVANGMKLLHKVELLHGYLAPHNVMLYSSPKDPRGFIAKLSGFDLPDNVLKDVYIIRKYNQEFFKNVTEQYTAPEVLDTRIVTKKAEVFSFGIIMWEVWHNSIFAELYDKEEIKRKRSGQSMEDYRPKASSKCPNSYVQLMTRCLDPVPELRPNFLGGHFLKSGYKENIVEELERLIHEEYQKLTCVED